MASTSDPGRERRAVFVGREPEQAELLAAVEGPPAQRPELFLVTGAPGIGKTALADQVAVHAGERGLRVLRARCWEDSSSPPYWPWTQLLRNLAVTDEPNGLPAPTVRGASLLARILPELADERPDPADAPSVADTGSDRFRLFDEIAALLAAAAAEQPLLLLIDDLHAADEASLHLLRFLVREDRVGGVVIVASAREIQGGPEATGMLGELVREGQVVPLAGLGLSEVARLVEQQTGITPAEGKVAAIFEVTEGNPLFVREVTRLLAATEPLHVPGRVTPPVPDSVRAVIRRRLSPLSADAIRALSAAAVVGRDFDLALAGPATGLPHDHVVAALSHSARLGIITVDEAAGRYRFTHPLFREVIYEDLPLGAHAELHLAVGEALEGRGLDADVEALAHHFAHAAATGAAAKALRYSWRAGDAAMASLAYEDAARQYGRALEAATLADAGEDEHCTLLLRLGHARACAGDYPAAKETFRRAAECARRLGTAWQLAEAALGFGEPQVQSGVSDRELRALLEEALAGVEAGALRARLLARLSLELTFASEAAAQGQLSREAVDLAREAGDAAALGAALRARWMAVWGPDGLQERLSLSHEMRELAVSTGDTALELVALARRITCWVEAGDVRAAEDDLAAHARLADEARMPYHRWTAASLEAMRALLTGRLEAAEERAARALDLGAGRPDAAHAHGNQLTVIRWEQGRLGELHATWRRLVEQFPRLGWARGWLALAEVERGHGAEARQQLHRLSEDLPEQPRDGLWLPTAAVAALAAHELDDRHAAARLSPLLDAYTDRVVAVGMPHPVVCLGSVWLFRALLAAVLADADTDALFSRAATANAQLEARTWQARTACAHAQVLLARGDERERVQERLREARDLAGAAGLPAVLARLAALEADSARSDDAPEIPGTADVAPVEAAADRVDAPAAPAEQFRREGDYWTIAFDGMLVRLRDTKGLGYLARLLANPGRELHAIDLERTEAPPDARRSAPSADDDLTARRDLGDAGALLDEQAKAAYRARLAELEADLEEAERHHDPERASRAREEFDFLTSELTRAVGLGGRDRHAASHTERARLNVTRAIRAAMAKIADTHPTLGEHLRATVRTGTYCSYTPDPRAPIRWNHPAET
ncbi:hypothetical protein ER308_02075 [Egibacter rhizosphaerae]|uniref:AAA+ ATPase domain-containing protein n=1 Tax=Egibacter rhizosphaerae TaxID=1670831 RepID=A0A411YB86_9ACTN|nr:AAA family ATPase [Egibacter rhizosphaerae]QBI18470.1 hypothetical protein ER308_02075 [Egibacter rhizosphaerae]